MRKSKCALPVLCGAASIFAMSSAMAQTNPGSTTSVSAQSTGIEEVTVSAERHADTVHNIPFSVTAVSAADLQKSSIVTTAALPQLVTGLTWSGQGPWVEPSLRGVSTTVASPGSGSPIAIYLDGVYQPQQISTIMDLPDVSSIEVDKGPQGTLFGRNATGGAIQINTVDPSSTPQGRFNLEAGMYSGGDSKTANHLSGSGYITGPISDTLSFGLAAWAQHTPGYIKDVVNGGRLGEVFSAGSRAKLLWKPDEDTSVLATVYYAGRRDLSTNALVPVNGLTAAAFYPGSIIASKPWTGAYYKPNNPSFTLGTFGSSLRITHYFQGVGTLTSTTGYNNYKPHVEAGPASAYSPACYDAFACVDYNAGVPEQALSQELLFSSDQLGRLQFVSGVFGFYDKGSEYDRAAGDGLVVYASNAVHYTRSFAVFTEANYNLTDALTLVAGVRFNYESLSAKGGFPTPLVTFADKSWDNLSPRFSLKYKASDNLNLYATYSQGFKAGVTATGYSSAPPANPEKLTSYEIGAKYQTQRFSLNGAFFYYDYKDLQGEFFDGLETFPSNVASATIFGIDADAAIQLTDEFQLKAGVTWLPRARNDSYPDAVVNELPLGPGGLTVDNDYDASGTRLSIAPKITFSMTGAYAKTLAAGQLDASATLYYSSNYQFDVVGLAKQGSYAALNAQIGFTPASMPDWRFGLYGRNLTDQAVINSVELPTTGYSATYAPPRELGISLQYSY